MQKIITIDEAVSKIHDGMSIMIGGFLTAGSPCQIISKIVEKKIKDLTLIVNDAAFADKGLGLLITNRLVKKVITSYIGSNTNAISQFNSKELEVEFVPQGTLAERVRCGGAGLGGVLTPTGLGTVVEEGKQKIEINGKTYLLETALHADVALVGASISDSIGNLYYKGTTQNFNPLFAMAADLVIAEVKELVEVGSIPMENIHTQSIFIDYIVKV